MAVTNTGIVERTITGVNESELFLDSEATSVTTNTGIVERSVVGVHDANFVRPLGDELVSDGSFTAEGVELITNGSFDSDSDWFYFSQWNISDNKANFLDTSGGVIYQNGVALTSGKTYKLKFTISNSSGNASLLFANGTGSVVYYGADYASYADGSYTLYITMPSSQTTLGVYANTSGNSFSIENISVKEVVADWALLGDFEVNNQEAYITNASQYSQLTNQIGTNYLLSGKTYKLTADIETLSIDGVLAYRYTGGAVQRIYTTDIVGGKFTAYFTMPQDGNFWFQTTANYTGLNATITNISVKEMLVNRESTTTNTGIVERSVTGLNESELWLDAESTSVVNNTGIVERPITGVNESDPMFPNNTISIIVNLVGNLVLALINAFKSRVSTDGGTLDNEIGLTLDDLDDTASFTMLPNAYKDGTLYSVLPEDGSGDFDVVRGSGATRVNKEGLIEDVRALSSNIVTDGSFTAEGVEEIVNGGFDTDTDWILQTGWNISGGKGIATNTTTNSIYQNVLTLSKSYKVSFTISSIESGGLKIGIGVNFSQEFTEVGTYTYYGTPSNDGLLRITPSNGTTATIDNVSVKEVAADWEYQSGWNFGDDKAIYEGTGSSYIRQANVLTVNKKHKITIEVLANEGTETNLIYFGSTIVNNTHLETGTHTFEGIATSNSFLIIYGRPNETFEITNISVIEITDDTNLPRINYEGFSFQDVLGSEEITNGGFDTDLSGWVTYSNTSTSWQSGGYALLDSNGGYWCKVERANVFEIGKTYKVILTAKSNRTDLSFHSSPIVGNFSQADTFETFEQYYTATTTQFLFGYANAGSATITIDNVSVVEVLGEEIVPDSGTPTLLLEPQSTNVMTYSNDYINGNWVKDNSTTTSGFVSPDGTTSAYKLTEDTSNTTHKMWAQETTLASTYSFSLFAKAGERRRIGLRDNQVGNNAIFDLISGTVVSGNGSIVALTNGYYRISLTGTYNAAGTRHEVYILEDNATNITAAYQGDGASGLYIYGAQLEALSYATSYIPTNGAIATRLADSVTDAGDATTFNSTEGVLYGEFSTIASDNNSNWINLSDGTSNNWMFVGRDSDKVRIYLKANGVVVFSNSTTPLANNNKVALSYKSGDIRAYINGVEVVNLTSSFSFSSSLNALNFGAFGGGNTLTQATWKDVRTYNTALTDAELLTLTTI